MWYEAVCDCCMRACYFRIADEVPRDCPICGVGVLLGPWPIRPRFETGCRWDNVVFPRFAEEVPVKRN